jgi:hypothetical protein
MSGTFLFADSPLYKALESNGYRLCKSSDKRYCFLQAPNAEFAERADYGIAIPMLHSSARWEECKKSKNGTWAAPDLSGYVIGRGGNSYPREFVEMFPYTYGR